MPATIEHTDVSEHPRDASRFSGAMDRIGRYEVLSYLAAGRRGHVYLARATGLGGFERLVAIETLEPHDDAVVSMFLDGARLAGAFHHQHITPIHEVGCDEAGRYFVVRDYVRGETAEVVSRSLCARGVPMPLAFALTVVSALASAVEYARMRCAPDGEPLDFMYRDMSLSNVMIGYDGAVRLMDLEVPRLASWMRSDYRSDVFALGVVLYELTAMPGVPSYPRDLELVLMKALQVDPECRFQDAGTMSRELDALAGRLGLTLGHTAITAVMHQLADRRSRPCPIDDIDTAPIEVTDEPTAPLAVPPVMRRTATGTAPGEGR